MHYIHEFQQLITNVFRGGSKIPCVFEGAADRRGKGSNVLLLPKFPKKPKKTAQTQENSWSVGGLPLVLAFLNIRQRTIIIHLNCTNFFFKKMNIVFIVFHPLRDIQI